MSPAFISGVGEHLSEQPPDENPAPAIDVAGPVPPAAPALLQNEGHADAAATDPPGSFHRPQIIFDRYHVVQVRHEAPCNRRGVRDPPHRAVAAVR